MTTPRDPQKPSGRDDRPSRRPDAEPGRPAENKERDAGAGGASTGNVRKQPGTTRGQAGGARKPAARRTSSSRAAGAARMHSVFATDEPAAEPATRPVVEPPVVEPQSPTSRVADRSADPSPVIPEPVEAPPPTPPERRHGPSERSWLFAERFRAEHPEAHRAREAAADVEGAPVSSGVATLLTFLARTIRARAVVEVGSGAGVSGLALLSGMVPGGVLTSIDPDPEGQRLARDVFRRAGLPTNRNRLITGPALVVMPKLSDAAYDLVFIDADPLESGEYVEQAERLLRDGGLLVLNNVLGEDRVADPDNDDDEAIVLRETLEAINQMGDSWVSTLLPVGDGVVVATRTR